MLSVRTHIGITRPRHYNLIFLHARRQSFPAFAEIVVALREIWPWGDVASVEEVESRLGHRWPTSLVEAATWQESDLFNTLLIGIGCWKSLRSCFIASQEIVQKMCNGCG